MQFNIEHQYLSTMTDLLKNAGDIRNDRTKVGTYSKFGTQLRHDMRLGFPLLTTKKVYWKGVVAELLWFLRGETNIKSLVDQNVHIWDEWATPEGNLGPVYGAMWRSWPVEGYSTVDQIKNLLADMSVTPESRRLVVSAWNPAYLPDPNLSPSENAAHGLQALPPCHTLFQVYCERIPRDERAALPEAQRHDLSAPSEETMDAYGVPAWYVSLQLYQRSADWFLGVPFNIASYALLLTLLARHRNMVPKEFVHTFGDYHLYSNHVEQARTQLSRAPLPLPKLTLNPQKFSLFDFAIEDIVLTDYTPHDAISAPVAV